MKTKRYSYAEIKARKSFSVFLSQFDFYPKFQAVCVKRGLMFRQGMDQAISQYLREHKFFHLVGEDGITIYIAMKMYCMREGINVGDQLKEAVKKWMRKK